MKLIIKRDKTSGFTGGIKFALTARAELTDKEKESIKLYKMGETIIYEKPNNGPENGGILALAKYRFAVPRIDVNDLINGKTIEVKSIAEVLDVEAQLLESGSIFQKLLTAAMTYEGETVHDFARA